VTRNEYGKAYEAGFLYTVRFLMSRSVAQDAATELAQAAWARGWERLSQLHDDSLVKTWVNTIALNMFRGGMRAKQPLFDVHDNGLTKIDLAAIDVAHILQSCSLRDQALLRQDMYGFTTAEIAHQENLSQTAVRLRLMRALRSARAQINRTAHIQALRALAPAG
jgi:DNA-directed RNA polymerase specialized sigma24 family protein